MYEISRRFPDLAELVLVEPSPTFYKWAKRFLKGKDLGWIPRVGKFEKPTYVKPNRPPEPIGPPQKLYIHNVAAEEIPRPANYFDLITCLNVIDRHNNPPGLVKILGDLLAPNGLLILASPLDYMAEFTPDKKLWVDDLNQLFMETEAATKWKSIDDQNIVYDFHYYCRKITRFNSHTVIKQKIG